MRDGTGDEVMTIVAARELRDGDVCFVGIGIPSAAANLARRLHAPNLVLVYESGTMGAKPDVLPLSIGDDDLAETADTIVSVPEIFAYWLQAGRIDVGFLGGAQMDRFGNLNTTVIGPYEAPRVRLPGAGGAPEIAAHARDLIVVMRHQRRSFVEELDFITTAASAYGVPALTSASAAPGVGAQEPRTRALRVVTDLGILEPDPGTRELVLTRIHPGITVEDVRRATGWPLAIAEDLLATPPVTARELEALRELRRRTALAHGMHRLSHDTP